ncbi:MAG: protein phosphatase 2C domain-containing protein [Desulfococcaceae bacterium]|jgi:protein phosphatase|nr:protein phosphatase 2C domain-containing protein [Desulfococcaceae bacterium]
MIVVESAGLTDVGMKRKGNEDALFFDDILKLYVVADGMGGHQAGEVASDLVVKTVKDYLERFQGGENVEEMEDTDIRLSKEANRLMSGIHLSNQVVYQAARSRQTYRGMGSTVSAIRFTDDSLIAVNVGDSPIYLIRDSEISLLSVTHTVMAEQEAMNRTGDKHFAPEYGHMLTRAIGVEDTVLPDICEIPCFKEDIAVIASDGLSNKVSEQEICEIAGGRKPAKACRTFVDLANERGGNDNITVIICRVKSVQQESGIAGMFSRFMRFIGCNC